MRAFSSARDSLDLTGLVCSCSARNSAGLFFGLRTGVDGPATGSTVGFLTIIRPLAGLDALMSGSVSTVDENKSQIALNSVIDRRRFRPTIIDLSGKTTEVKSNLRVDC